MEFCKSASSETEIELSLSEEQLQALLSGERGLAVVLETC
jgi:hypothetical protein